MLHVVFAVFFVCVWTLIHALRSTRTSLSPSISLPFSARGQHPHQIMLAFTPTQNGVESWYFACVFGEMQKKSSDCVATWIQSIDMKIRKFIQPPKQLFTHLWIQFKFLPCCELNHWKRPWFLDFLVNPFTTPPCEKQRKSIVPSFIPVCISNPQMSSTFPRQDILIQSGRNSSLTLSPSKETSPSFIQLKKKSTCVARNPSWPKKMFHCCWKQHCWWEVPTHFYAQVAFIKLFEKKNTRSTVEGRE